MPNDIKSDHCVIKLFFTYRYNLITQYLLQY